MSDTIQHSENRLELKESFEATKFIDNLSDPTITVVDFDETLFLRNSTEAYLDSIQPQLLGNILLVVLEKLNIWRWLPKPLRNQESMDWLRVVIATVLFPWTLLIWKNKAKKLAYRYTNPLLLESLQNNPNAKVVVATRGFDFIVKPLLRHMPLQVDRLIGCRFLSGGYDRQLGKEEMLVRQFSEREIRSSALITDSLDDASLLAIAKYPFLVRWPDAKYIRAMSGAYLPFFYLEKVKKPGQNFTATVVIKDYLVALIFACTWLSSMPLFHAAGMVLLTFSFWCIYEIGYFENDLVAEKYEAKPVLSDTYQQYKDRMAVFLPWFVSLVAAIPGIALVLLGNTVTWNTVLDWSLYPRLLEWQTFAVGLGLWVAALIGTRLLFFVYNYLDEITRIWIYPLLQFAKYSGILLVAQVSTVGLALLIAQVFVEWIPYVIYRCGGDRTLLKEQIFRVFIFLLLTVSVVIVQRDAAILLTGQFVAILLWYCARSVSQAKELFRNAHLIWN
ncbi:MAG: haloacid dehalogenase-like hydrolase [Leptolyngbya sp. SIOISBB]|nr:haloacid dehalogenase-like hydrolase [Leptolyngbya sp. SIOISBB]